MRRDYSNSKKGLFRDDAIMKNVRIRIIDYRTPKVLKWARRKQYLSRHVDCFYCNHTHISSDLFPLDYILVSRHTSMTNTHILPSTFRSLLSTMALVPHHHHDFANTSPTPTMSRDELIQQSPRVGAPIQEVRAWVSAFFLYRGHKVNTDNIMWDGRQLRSLSRQALYGAIKEHTDLSDRDSDHASFDIKEILSVSSPFDS